MNYGKNGKINFVAGVAVVLLALAPVSLFAENPPVPQSDVEGLLGNYASQMKNHGKNVVRYELADTEGRFTSDIDGLRYSGYYRDCFVFWQGNYGEVYRETLSVKFLCGIGGWNFDQYEIVPNTKVQTQAPSKPLPNQPEKPGEEQLKKEILAELMKRDSDNKFTIKKIDFPDPEFSWLDEYSSCEYHYDGYVTYTALDYESPLCIINVKKTVKKIARILMEYSVANKTWTSMVYLE